MSRKSKLVLDQVAMICDLHDDPQRADALRDVAAEIDSLEERNARLRRVLTGLVNFAPSGHQCSEFHHGKADRHYQGEYCRPQERWLDAIGDARGVLAAEGLQRDR